MTTVKAGEESFSMFIKINKPFEHPNLQWLDLHQGYANGYILIPDHSSLAKKDIEFFQQFKVHGGITLCCPTETILSWFEEDGLCESADLLPIDLTTIKDIPAYTNGIVIGFDTLHGDDDKRFPTEYHVKQELFSLMTQIINYLLEDGEKTLRELKKLE